MTRSNWTKAQEARLKILVEEGKSTTAIAAIMKTSSGRIIGKAHRLGLTFTYKSTRQAKMRTEQRNKRKYSKKQVSEPKPPTIIPESMPLPHALLVGMEDLTSGMCPFPHGTSTPYRFCGLPIADKRAHKYCPDHQAVCYRPVTDYVEPPSLVGEARRFSED